MATVRHIHRARKDNPTHGIKKGDEYWCWTMGVNGRFVRRYSKRRPRPSMLTSSPFWKSFHQIEEAVQYENAPKDETLRELELIREEEQEKFDNAPDNLKDAPTGTLMQNRIEALDELISNIEALDDDHSNEQLLETFSHFVCE